MTHDSQLMTRRRSLQLIGAGSGGLLLAGLAHPGRATARTEGNDYVANASNACMLTAEQEEGPFYVALDDVRSNIVLGQAGLPLDLTVTVISSLTCKPLKHAAIDLWQCNAAGVYSDITQEKTFHEKFLRGVQFTDSHGRATFTTIYPGHYAGRTTHIHAKVHINSADSDNTLTGGHVAHTAQMFPPDAVNTEVFALSEYQAARAQIVTHAEDKVYRGQHGSESQITITKVGSTLSKGLAGSIVLAVNPNATPKSVGGTSSASTVAGDG